ncbi:MAG: carboxypeptidase-like regulatory domain-containing protein [Chloroflexota bacterium]
MPNSTWTNGLAMVSGVVNGNVTDNAGNPIEGANVLLVDGTQTANLQDLTAYQRVVYSNANGEFTLRHEGTGNKTLYVVKSGYRHLYKTYNFAQADQNILFPTAVLTT